MLFGTFAFFLEGLGSGNLFWDTLCMLFWTKVAMSMLCWLRGGIPTIEQPRNSKLVYHPVMQQWLQLLGASNTSMHRHDYDPGLFGAPTQKPIWVYTPVSLELDVPLVACAHAPDHPPTAIVQLGVKHM